MLSPNDLFGLSAFPFRDLFDNLEYAWQALPKISLYIESLVNIKGIRKPSLPGVFYIGDLIHIDEGVIIEPGTVIKSPTFVARGAELRAGAYLREGSLIASGAIVGHSTEVKNSIFFPNAHAPHFNYVGDSILGNNTNIGAGTKLSNYKIMNEKSIHVTIEGQIIDTGLNKFGAILGDGAEMGCNSVANPGTIIGQGSLIYACAAIRGYINPQTIVKLIQTFEEVEKH
jgi:NDP-sugar pyrophosphorylase family protein